MVLKSAEAKARRNKILTQIVLIIMAFIMLVPFAWMILTALKTNQESISVNPFYILRRTLLRPATCLRGVFKKEYKLL